MEKLIHSAEELADALGTTVDMLERDMFKYTDCGMAISWNQKRVLLTGYVENDSDYCGPNRELEFPFYLQEFNETVDVLDKQACEIWDCLNLELNELLEKMGVTQEEYEALGVSEEDFRWDAVNACVE